MRGDYGRRARPGEVTATVGAKSMISSDYAIRGCSAPPREGSPSPAGVARWAVGAINGRQFSDSPLAPEEQGGRGGSVRHLEECPGQQPGCGAVQGAGRISATEPRRFPRRSQRPRASGTTQFCAFALSQPGQGYPSMPYRFIFRQSVLGEIPSSVAVSFRLPLLRDSAARMASASASVSGDLPAPVSAP